MKYHNQSHNITKTISDSVYAKPVDTNFAISYMYFNHIFPVLITVCLSEQNQIICFVHKIDEKYIINLCNIIFVQSGNETSLSNSSIRIVLYENMQVPLKYIFTSIHCEGFICLDQVGYQGTDMLKTFISYAKHLTFLTSHFILFAH